MLNLCSCLLLESQGILIYRARAAAHWPTAAAAWKSIINKQKKKAFGTYYSTALQRRPLVVMKLLCSNNLQ